MRVQYEYRLRAGRSKNKDGSMDVPSAYAGGIFMETCHAIKNIFGKILQYIR